MGCSNNSYLARYGSTLLQHVHVQTSRILTAVFVLIRLFLDEAVVGMQLPHQDICIGSGRTSLALGLASLI